MTLGDAQLCLLRFLAATDATAWVSLFRIDHLRRLAPDDLAVLPHLVEDGLVEHDPDASRIRISGKGRMVLAARAGSTPG